MQGLGVGRIVHIRLPYGVRPAIVTRVIDGDTGIISAHVFTDLDDPPGVPINEKTGTEYSRAVEYSKEDTLGTWCWPPRA